MSNKVYSFTKVSKRHTKVGNYCLPIGIVSIVVLCIFLGYGTYLGGQMSGVFCLIPYLTMIASIAGAVISEKNVKRTDVAGKYLVAGYRVCLLSSVLYVGVLLIGILKIIM